MYACVDADVSVCECGVARAYVGVGVCVCASGWVHAPLAPSYEFLVPYTLSLLYVWTYVR